MTSRPTSSLSLSHSQGHGHGYGWGESRGAGGREKSYFEQQREALIGDIAMSFEHVLANINKLNRSLEAVIAVGNEFSSVEALWSQFEGVMGKDQEEDQEDHPGAGGGGGDGNRDNDDGGEQAGRDRGSGEDEDEADKTAVKSE